MFAPWQMGCPTNMPQLSRVLGYSGCIHVHCHLDILKPILTVVSAFYTRPTGNIEQPWWVLCTQLRNRNLGKSHLFKEDTTTSFSCLKGRHFPMEALSLLYLSWKKMSNLLSKGRFISQTVGYVNILEMIDEDINFQMRKRRELSLSQFIFSLTKPTAQHLLWPAFSSGEMDIEGPFFLWYWIYLKVMTKV